MKGYGDAVRELLRQNGCWFVRMVVVITTCGAARMSRKPFTVPVKIDSRHTANKILKDAGLAKAF